MQHLEKVGDLTGARGHYEQSGCALVEVTRMLYQAGHYDDLEAYINSQASQEGWVAGGAGGAGSRARRAGSQGAGSTGAAELGGRTQVQSRLHRGMNSSPWATGHSSQAATHKFPLIAHGPGWAVQSGSGF